MTASQQAKTAGFKSLIEVAELINKTRATLNNWFHDNRVLFDSVIIGLAKIKEDENEH